MAQLDIEHRTPVAQGRDGGLHAFDVAAVVGPPHVDQRREAAIDLALVIGDIGGKIRVGAVRFDQRTVDVVAEVGRTEQHLFAIFVVVARLSLGGRQAARIDEALAPKLVDRERDGIRVAVPFRQRPFRKEPVEADAKPREIGADIGQHGRDSDLAYHREPIALFPLQKPRPMQLNEPGAARLQVVARIEPLGHRADLLPQRLPIAEERRAGQDIDLGARIVDVILPGHRVTREGQEVGQGIPEHGAPAVADMKRSGRIGRHILDVDRRPGRTDSVPAAAERHAARERSPEHVGIDVGPEHHVDEAGTGDLRRIDVRIRREDGRDRDREGPRVAVMRFGLLGVDHGGVDREVAMRRIARRLDDEALEFEPGRESAALDQFAEDDGHTALEVGEDVHGVLSNLRPCRVVIRVA